MALTLTQLITALTTTQARSQVLLSLQGVGFVTKVGTGTGSLTASGQGAITNTVAIKIVTSGELGTGAFQWSVDNGVTYSGNVTIPSGGSYTVSTSGVTVLFVAGPTGAGTSFVAADLYTLPVNTINFPVTSWPTGGAGRTLAEVEAQVVAVFSQSMSQLAASGFLQSWLVPTVPPTPSSWLDLLGSNVYQLTRNAAVPTAGNVVFTDAASAGPFTIAVGQITVSSTTGQQYINTTGGTLTKGGTLTLAVQATVAALAGNVGLGTVTTITGGTLPGVTVNNPGAAGVWITTSGSDAETDLAFATRCQNRWPSIGIGATAATYDYWARTASANVARTLVQTDGSVAGQVDVYLAGTAAPVAGADVTAVQSYINARVPLTSTCVVSNTTGLAINVVAAASVKAASYNAAVTAAAANLAGYINSLSVSAGSTIVSYDIIIAMIGEIAGVTSLTSVTVNAGTTDITMTLGQLATVGSVTITWTQV